MNIPPFLGLWIALVGLTPVSHSLAEPDPGGLFGGTAPEIFIEQEAAEIGTDLGSSYLSVKDGFALTLAERRLNRYDVKGQLKVWDLHNGRLRRTIEFPSEIWKIAAVEGNRKAIVLGGINTVGSGDPYLALVDLDLGSTTLFSQNQFVTLNRDVELTISKDRKSVLLRQGEFHLQFGIDRPGSGPQVVDEATWKSAAALDSSQTELVEEIPNWIARVGDRDRGFALAVSDNDQSAGLWRIDSWERVISFGQSLDPWRGWSPSHDGRRLLSWNDKPEKGFTLWDFEAFRVQRIEVSGFRPELHPAFSADGRWLRYQRTSGHSAEVEIVSLDLENGSEKIAILLPPDSFEHFLEARIRGVFSPNGQHLLLEIGPGEFLRISWDDSGNSSETSISVPDGHPVSVSDDGVMASFSSGKGGGTNFRLMLMNLRTGKPLSEWNVETAGHVPVFSAAYSPDTGLAALSHYTSGGSLGYYGGRVSVLEEGRTSNVPGYNLDEGNDHRFGQSWSIAVVEPEGTGDELLAIYSNNGRIQTWDSKRRRYVHRYEWTDCETGIYGGAMRYPLHTRVFAAKNGRAFLPVTHGGIRVVDLLPDGTSRRVADLWSLPNQGWSAILPNGYFSCSAGSERHILFRKDGSVHSFEQFDRHLNRPDLVAAELGAGSGVTDALKTLHERRITSLAGESTATPFDLASAPLVELVGPAPLTHDEAVLTVTASIRIDAGALPARVEVVANGVPFRGKEGLIFNSSSDQTLSLQVPISPGQNRIEISCRDQKGRNSPAISFSVHRNIDHRPDLYLLSIGVAEYQTPDFVDLPLARKDAIDIAEALAQRGRGFDKIHKRVILDRDVTRENVLEAAAMLQSSRPGDQVIVFASGHGMLDTDLRYFYCPFDMKPEDPAKRGLSFEDLESLFEEIGSSQRLLMLDTCHAGEPSYLRQTSPGLELPRPSQGIPGREANPRSLLVDSKFSRSIEDRLLEDYFIDLNRRNGITVLTGSDSKGEALEHPDWKNGAFTASLLKILGDRPDGLLASELASSVSDSVVRLTEGRQRPSLRAINLSVDFPVGSADESSASETPETFLRRFLARSSSTSMTDLKGLVNLFAPEVNFFGENLTREELKGRLETDNRRHTTREYQLEKLHRSGNAQDTGAVTLEFSRRFRLSFLEETTQVFNKQTIPVQRVAWQEGSDRLRIEIHKSGREWTISRVDRVE